MTSVEVAVIDAAIERIQRFGWTQRTAGDECRGFCTWGAYHDSLVEALGKDYSADDYRAIDNAVWAAMQEASLELWNDDSPITVNDTKMTSADDAIQLLRKARMLVASP